LPSGTRDVVQRRDQRGSVADALWPQLRPAAPKPTNPYRDILLKSLREINARHKQPSSTK
jgi:hypothetical protein